MLINSAQNYSKQKIKEKKETRKGLIYVVQLTQLIRLQ
jgi:hypothetical protein